MSSRCSIFMCKGCCQEHLSQKRLSKSRRLTLPQNGCTCGHTEVVAINWEAVSINQGKPKPVRLELGVEERRCRKIMQEASEPVEKILTSCAMSSGSQGWLMKYSLFYLHRISGIQSLPENRGTAQSLQVHSSTLIKC